MLDRIVKLAAWISAFGLIATTAIVAQAQAPMLDPDWDNCRGYPLIADLRWDLIDVDEETEIGLSPLFRAGPAYFGPPPAGSGSWNLLARPGDVIRGWAFLRFCKNVTAGVNGYGGVQGSINWHDSLITLQEWTPGADVAPFLVGPQVRSTSYWSVRYDFRGKRAFRAGEVVDLGVGTFRVVGTNVQPPNSSYFRRSAAQIGHYDYLNAGTLWVNPQTAVVALADPASILPAGEFPLPGGIPSGDAAVECAEDVDGSGAVDEADLARVVEAQGPCP